jgi:hypothetical protein
MQKGLTRMSTPNRHFKPNAVYADPNRHEPTTMDAIRHELGSRFEERKGEFWLDGRRTDFFTLAKAAGINLRNRR